MNYTPHNVRNDPPPRPDQIQLDEGCLSQFPTRILRKHTVKKLLELDAERGAFEQEVLTRRAQLNEAWAEGVETQQIFTDLIASRKQIASELVEFENAFSEAKSLKAQLETAFPSSRELDQHIANVQRVGFKVDRLPALIQERRQRLDEVKEAIGSFAKREGITEIPI